MTPTTGDNPTPHSQRGTPAQLAEFARGLRDHRRSMPQTLDEILRSAIALIDQADSGCITTLSRDTREVVASTCDLAEKLCRRQYEMGEGPITSEVRNFDVVIADDLEAEGRWPQFAAAAVEDGVRSLAAFQLFSNTDDLGALVLYSTAANAFDDEAVVVGEALAAHAAIALLGVRDGQQFRSGLASRDIIGQAKGMIMERYKIDASQAFELLVTLSQEQNEPLRIVARGLIDAEYPQDDPAPS